MKGGNITTMKNQTKSKLREMNLYSFLENEMRKTSELQNNNSKKIKIENVKKWLSQKPPDFNQRLFTIESQPFTALILKLYYNRITTNTFLYSLRDSPKQNNKSLIYQPSQISLPLETLFFPFKLKMKQNWVSQEILDNEEKIIDKLLIGSTKLPFDSLFFSKKALSNLDQIFEWFELVSGGKSFQWSGRVDKVELPTWFNVRSFHSLTQWILAHFEKQILTSFLHQEKVDLNQKSIYFENNKYQNVWDSLEIEQQKKMVKDEITNLNSATKQLVKQSLKSSCNKMKASENYFFLLKSFDRSKDSKIKLSSLESSVLEKLQSKDFFEKIAFVNFKEALNSERFVMNSLICRIASFHYKLMLHKEFKVETKSKKTKKKKKKKKKKKNSFCSFQKSLQQQNSKLNPSRFTQQIGSLKTTSDFSQINDNDIQQKNNKNSDQRSLNLIANKNNSQINSCQSYQNNSAHEEIKNLKKVYCCSDVTDRAPEIPAKINSAQKTQNSSQKSTPINSEVAIKRKPLQSNEHKITSEYLFNLDSQKKQKDKPVSLNNQNVFSFLVNQRPSSTDFKKKNEQDKTAVLQREAENLYSVSITNAKSTQSIFRTGQKINTDKDSMNIQFNLKTIEVQILEEAQELSDDQKKEFVRNKSSEQNRTKSVYSDLPKIKKINNTKTIQAKKHIQKKKCKKWNTSSKRLVDKQKESNKAFQKQKKESQVGSLVKLKNISTWEEDVSEDSFLNGKSGDQDRRKSDSNNHKKGQGDQRKLSIQPFALFCPLSAFNAALQQDYLKFINKIQQITLEQEQPRKKIIQKLRNCLCEKFNNSQIQLKSYGSYETQLLTPFSDVDLQVRNLKISGRDEALVILNEISEFLNKQNFVNEAKAILTATVPLVKISAKAAEDSQIIHLDLILDYCQEITDSAFKTTSFVKNKSYSNVTFLKNVIFLKFLLSYFGLSDPYTGGLNSYGLSILYLSFLKYINKETSNEYFTLLIQFLGFLGSQFDFNSFAVYLHDSQRNPFIPKKVFMYQQLVVFDPVQYELKNVTNSCHKVKEILDLWKNAFIRYQYYIQQIQGFSKQNFDFFIQSRKNLFLQIFDIENVDLRAINQIC